MFLIYVLSYHVFPGNSLTPVRSHAITWTNVDLDVQYHLASPGHNELTISGLSPSGFNSLAPGKFAWNFRNVIFKQILVIDVWGISREIALIWMSLDFTDYLHSLT